MVEQSDTGRLRICMSGDDSVLEDVVEQPDGVLDLDTSAMSSTIGEGGSGKSSGPVSRDEAGSISIVRQSEHNSFMSR